MRREDWPAHPNYPSQVLLVRSHDSFRWISAQLIDLARDLERAELLEVRYRGWIAAMRSHEAYEERKLYPYLARRWGVSFDVAEAGHRSLHARHAAVLGAFGGARSALVDALVLHDEVLTEHLQLEEELVIPLLLQLSADEFETYYHSSIESLLRGFDERDRHGEAGERQMDQHRGTNSDRGGR